MRARRKPRASRSKRNPARIIETGPSALTLAEAGIIQDVFLVALAGAAVYGVYWLLTRNPGTPAQNVAQILGYTPGAGTTPGPATPDYPGGATPQNTIPNPSDLAGGAHGTQPWLPSGPTASSDGSYDTELGSGGSEDALGPVASSTAYA